MTKAEDVEAELARASGEEPALRDHQLEVERRVPCAIPSRSLHVECKDQEGESRMAEAENVAAEWARVSGEETALRDHQLEIQRRAQVARAPFHSGFDKVKEPGDDPPFEDPDQQ